MTANELIDKLESVSIRLLGKETEQAGRAIILYRESAIMLLQQAQKIEALKKELALQRLSDFSQEIEDRESAIYATGYWNGIHKAKEKNETLDTRSYLIGRYDKLRELTDEEIEEVAKPYCDLQNWVVDKHEFARAILKKAIEK